MLSPACAPLVDALVAKHPAFAADVGSPATLLAALRSGACWYAAAMNLACLAIINAR